MIAVAIVAEIRDSIFLGVQQHILQERPVWLKESTCVHAKEWRRRKLIFPLSDSLLSVLEFRGENAILMLNTLFLTWGSDDNKQWQTHFHPGSAAPLRRACTWPWFLPMVGCLLKWFCSLISSVQIQNNTWTAKLYDKRFVWNLL